MDNDIIISNLNKALQLEYSDIFLYAREAKLIEDKAISSIFEKFGLMETRHADLLAQRILALEGKPLWNFSLLEEKRAIKEIIGRHIDYEQRSIDYYSKILEGVDDETKIILRGIKAEEEVHLSKLKEFLGQKSRL